MSLLSVRPIIQNNPNQDVRDLSVTDPVTVLPNDIWKTILPFFNFQECIKCTWISHKWKNYIEESKCIDSHIATIKLLAGDSFKTQDLNKSMQMFILGAKIADLMPYKKGLSYEEFFDIIPENQMLLCLGSHIVLYGLGMSSTARIKELILSCKHMKHVDTLEKCFSLFLSLNSIETAIYLFSEYREGPQLKPLKDIIAWLLKNDRLEEAMEFYKTQFNSGWVKSYDVNRHDSDEMLKELMLSGNLFKC